MTLPQQRKLKVLLISNYQADRQQSMRRFADMLAEGLTARGHQVSVISPTPYLGKLSALGQLGTKWLGYLDKFALFLPALIRAANEADIVHICDHSNSLYVPVVNQKAHLITCHDLLAVRAGLGENTFVDLNLTGKLLQQLILSGLKAADTIVCDSNATREDALRLINQKDHSQIKTVLLGLNRKLQVLSRQECTRRLSSIAGLDTEQRFLLNVGSSLRRKNRAGVLRIFQRVAESFAGQLVFCGSPLPDELRNYVQEAGLSKRVVEIVDADDSTLEALYNAAHALVFPSFSEGFGWPILEAQACNCPVICSNTSSCPEAAGGAAFLHPPDDEAGFADDVLKLFDEGLRQRTIELGRANSERFSCDRTVDSYQQIYFEVLERLEQSGS